MKEKDPFDFSAAVAAVRVVAAGATDEAALSALLAFIVAPRRRARPERNDWLVYAQAALPDAALDRLAAYLVDTHHIHRIGYKWLFYQRDPERPHTRKPGWTEPTFQRTLTRADMLAVWGPAFSARGKRLQQADAVRFWARADVGEFHWAEHFLSDFASRFASPGADTTMVEQAAQRPVDIRAARVCIGYALTPRRPR